MLDNSNKSSSLKNTAHSVLIFQPIVIKIKFGAESIAFILFVVTNF